MVKESPLAWKRKRHTASTVSCRWHVLLRGAGSTPFLVLSGGRGTPFLGPDWGTPSLLLPLGKSTTAVGTWDQKPWTSKQVHPPPPCAQIHTCENSTFRIRSKMLWHFCTWVANACKVQFPSTNSLPTWLKAQWHAIQQKLVSNFVCTYFSCYAFLSSPPPCTVRQAHPLLWNLSFTSIRVSILLFYACV